ncbi:MAG TPA: glycosyltransferase family 9 protein [Humisphaera sp.]|nr:glycosyltransferase family 9 protein [Humisphaera sp.]
MTLKRNVLIFHLGALGDFIITWPLALTLARLYPQSRVFYVTHGQKGALAERILRVESYDVEGGWHRLFSEEAELPAPAAKALAGAHTLVSFLADPDGRWAANCRQANPGVSLLNLCTTMPEGFVGHVTEFLNEQLSAWPAAQTAAVQILRSINERGLLAIPNSTGPVVIHPGSGAARKNWPPEKFAQLCERLRKDGRDARVILGEVELEQWPPALIAQLESSAQVLRPKNLLELHDHISAAKVFVGNDSGPTHLAGILGIPTVAIFGPTSNPVRWKPLGPRVRIVSGELNELPVDAVYTASRLGE